MTTTDDRTAPADARVRTELAISGMTCGACSARIERRLGRLDGVSASVNLTTERAAVEHAPDRPVADLVALVEKLGFGAEVVAPAPAVPAARTAPDADLPAAGPLAAGPVPEPGPEPGPEPESDLGPGAESAAEPTGAPTAPPVRPDPELDDLRHRAFLCLAMTVPVVAVAMIGPLQVTYWQWFSLLLAAPVIVWGGWRFHRNAVRHLRHGQVTMDTLISLGSLAALAWSLGALFIGEAGLGGVRHNLTLVPRPDLYGGDRTIYLETGAAIVTAVLFGRWIELRGRRRALRDTGGADAGEAPVADAWLRVPTTAGLRELGVPVANLVVGDDVTVRPGGVVPCDGTVVAGRSHLDAASMTGESLPVEVRPGATVLAGTTNGETALVVRATHVGPSTQWARMRRRLADAQVGKASVQRLADRVAAWFVPAVLVLAVYTLLFWWFADGPDIAAAAAMAVLVVACPCALGLATPTALAVATGRGAQLGILLRGPEVLERTRRVDTVVLDKTGTLTTGRMTVHDAVLAPGATDEDAATLWRRVVALEHAVEHPVARALAAAAPEGTVLPTPEEAARVVAARERLDGLGVRGPVDGVDVLVGRRLLHERYGTVVDDDLDAARRDAEQQGHTAVLVAWPDPADGPGSPPRARAVLAVADTVRPTSARGVARLRAMGLRPMLVTGDNAAVAARVAAEVGIDADDVVADVLPTDKADIVARLRGEGATVAMVGDGVNDAAALAQADLGLAMGAGTALAIDAADLTLVRNDVDAVPDALRLARRTLRTIRTNLFWAFAYNTAALPLAALGLLNPMIAGLAMALSSVFVVANSLRLRRFTLQAAAGEAADAVGEGAVRG